MIVALATAVIAPIVLAGHEDRNVPSEDQAFEATVPTETRTPRPAGRDLGAVTEALRTLDPCRLPGVEFARSRGLPDATAIPTGPHSCLLRADASYSPGDEKGIEVRVGTPYAHIARYRAAPATIAGAKAYEEVTRLDGFSECRVNVPVSPVRAIEFAYEADDGADPCPTTRRFAEAAVAALRDPDRIAMRPATRPFAAWDGCSLLAQVIDTDEFLLEPDGLADPFAGCHGTPRAGGDGQGPRLKISYDEAPEPMEPIRRIAGKSVEVREDSEWCTAIWDNGPSGNRTKWFAATVVELTVDCEAIPDLVTQVVSLAEKVPPDSSAEPQRPLLYAPTDNDTATKGACVDFSNGTDDDCEPYQQVDLPGSAKEILAAAEANRHAQCAVFADAVVARFGPTYTPLTWGAHCFFVEPSHELEIRVNVSAGGWGTAPGGYGRGDLYRDRQVTEIAGLPAVTFWDSQGTTFDVYVSPHDELSAPGNLHIGIDARPARGSDVVTVSVDQAQADRAVEVMTQIVETFFT